jgi:hypothetical protein
VTWSRLRTLDLDGSDQTINLIEVDPSAGWDWQPHAHSGCQTVPDAADDIGAFAAINGGFFSSGCTSDVMVKEDGVLHSTNTLLDWEMRTIGWSSSGAPRFEWIDEDTDWPAVSNALGGYPSLVTDGLAHAEVYPGETVWSSTDWSAHPRTAVGVSTAGDLMMLTLDGRTRAGDGLTTPALADLMVDLGAQQAINLDGGGSTTMVIEDCWIGDVVNAPSDDGSSGHEGERAVSDGLYIR